MVASGDEVLDLERFLRRRPLHRRVVAERLAYRRHQLLVAEPLVGVLRLPDAHRAPGSSVLAGRVDDETVRPIVVDETPDPFVVGPRRLRRLLHEHPRHLIPPFLTHVVSPRSSQPTPADAALHFDRAHASSLVTPDS